MTGMAAQDKPFNIPSFPSARGASGAKCPQKRLHSDTHPHAQLLEKLNDYYCRCVCGRRVLSYRLVNGRGQHAERRRNGSTVMPFGRSVRHAAIRIPTPQSDSRYQRPGSFRFLWPCIVSKVLKRDDQQDATIRCLLLTSVSTCFGHHHAHLQENKGPVTAFGVLFCNKRENVDISHDVFCGVVTFAHTHTHTNSQLGLLHTTPQKRRHG